MISIGFFFKVVLPKLRIVKLEQSFLEAKSSDPRATFGYLLEEMTKVYDSLPLVDKAIIEVAEHSGFYNNTTYIVNQSNQYDLHTQQWLPLEQNGMFILSTYCHHSTSKIVFCFFFSSFGD